MSNLIKTYAFDEQCLFKHKLSVIRKPLVILEGVKKLKRAVEVVRQAGRSMYDVARDLSLEPLSDV
jgi:hypothetical protein